MKKILFFIGLLLMSVFVRGQSIGYLRYDTVKIMKVGGSAELILMSSTRDSVGGLLVNIGGGKTQFRKPRMLNDSTLVVGYDTVVIRGGVGSGGSGSGADSTIFATLYRLDSAKENLRNEIAGKQPVGNYILNDTTISQGGGFNVNGWIQSDSSKFTVSNGYWIFKNSSVNNRLGIFKYNSANGVTAEKIIFKSGGGAIALANSDNDSPGWAWGDSNYVSNNKGVYFVKQKDKIGQLGYANNTNYNITSGRILLTYDSIGNISQTQPTGSFTTTGRVGIKTQNLLQALNVGGQAQIDTITTGGSSDSVLVTRDGLIMKVLQSSIAGSQDLQSVTDVGHETTSEIVSKNHFGVSIKTSGNQLLAEVYANATDDAGIIQLYDLSAQTTKYMMDSIVYRDSALIFPHKRGTIALLDDITGITAITANNGLTANTSTNVQLGEPSFPGSNPLLANTWINTDAYSLILKTATGGVTPLSVQATTGSGILASVSGSGGYGGYFQNSNASPSGNALVAEVIPSSTNSVAEIALFRRNTQGAAANGIGGGLGFYIQNVSGSSNLSNQLISKWTGATDATRTSQFDITGVNSATTETFANFQTGGIVRVNNLADTLATKAYARSVGGGGGSGTVTSIATNAGSGITGGTITTTGTIAADTSNVLSTKYWRQKGIDSVATLANTKEVPLTFSTGLTRTTNTITANLATGVSGGQTLTFGTGSGDNGTITSTSNGTKGKILFGTSAYDEVNNRLGITQLTPTAKLHILTSGFGTTQDDSYGILLTDTSTASSGNQKKSPPIVWQGNGWKTTSTAASQDVRFRADVLPVQGSTNPTGTWQLASSINAGSYTNRMTVTSAGVVTASSFVGNLTGGVTGNVNGNLTGNVTGNVTTDLIISNGTELDVNALGPINLNTATNVTGEFVTNANLTQFGVYDGAGVNMSESDGSGNSVQMALQGAATPQLYFNCSGGGNNINIYGDPVANEIELTAGTVEINGLGHTVSNFDIDGTLIVGSTTTLSALSGTGTRAVLADATGVLSAPISDITTKQNISDLSYGVETVMKLRPVSFTYRPEFQNYGKGTQVGFIAQDIEKILPNSVYINYSNGKKGYNEIDLVPLLVKAVQEQQVQIQSLQQQVLELKNK